MKRFLPILSLSIASALIVPAVTHAVLIRVDFSVLADTRDPLYPGQTATGCFSFDSSLVPSGGGRVSYASLAEFHFTWPAHAWTTSDAGNLYLDFTPTGALSGWVIGGAPSGLETISPMNWPDIILGSDMFWYTTMASSMIDPYGAPYYVFTGTLDTWTVTPLPVPEPGLSLLGVGLMSLCLARRRRN